MKRKWRKNDHIHLNKCFSLIAVGYLSGRRLNYLMEMVVLREMDNMCVWGSLSIGDLMHLAYVLTLLLELSKVLCEV